MHNWIQSRSARTLGVAAVLGVAALVTPAAAQQLPSNVSAYCKKLYETEYRSGKGAKAFAVGSIQGCGYRTEAVSIELARERAVAACREYAFDCKVVAESRK